MSELIFRHCVICDDIRQEANGKFFFIGVYSNAMLLPDFPQGLALAFGIWATGTPGETYNCVFELSTEPPTEFKSGINVEFALDDDESQAFLPIPPLPVKLENECVVVLREVNSNTEVVRLRAISSAQDVS